MRQHGKSMNTSYSGKAFRLFAALLCMLFTAPLSHAQAGFVEGATLNAVSGPANEVIEAVNVTTQFAPREAHTDNSGTDDNRDPRAPAILPDPGETDTNDLNNPGPKNLVILPAGLSHAAHGKRAPPLPLHNIRLKPNRISSAAGPL